MELKLQLGLSHRPAIAGGSTPSNALTLGGTVLTLGAQTLTLGA